MFNFSSKGIIDRKFHSVYYTVRTFLKNTTIQCYHYLVDPGLHWTERVFWLICIGVVSGYGGLLTWRAYEDFSRNPISLTVDNLYLYWESSLPAIVVCDVWMDEGEGGYKGIENLYESRFENETDKVVERSEAIRMAREFVYYRGDMSNSQECVDNMEYSPFCTSYDNKITELTSLRLKCDEIFEKCRYKNRDFNCCDEFKPMNTVYGTCYAINSLATNDNNTKLYKVKAMESPTLTMYFKSPFVYMFSISPEETTSFRESEGQKLDYRYIVHPSIIDVYLKFKPMVNDAQVRKVPIEVRGCRFPDENNLKLSRIYSYPACIVERIAEQQLAECNCYQFYITPGADPKRFCNSLKQVYCITLNFAIFAAKAGYEGGCLPSCVETQVEKVGEISLKRGKSDSAQFDWDPKKVNLSKINIHFDTPRMRYHRRVLRDTTDMIVNVGGIGTLFFGASVISIIEIIYYFFILPCKCSKDDDKPQFQPPKYTSHEIMTYVKFKKRLLLPKRKTKVIPFRN